MNKFLYGVSDLVKTECINGMLLRDMNISRIITHAQQFESDKLREQARMNKSLGLRTITILSKNLVMEIGRSVSRTFQLHILQKHV